MNTAARKYINEKQICENYLHICSSPSRSLLSTSPRKSAKAPGFRLCASKGPKVESWRHARSHVPQSHKPRLTTPSATSRPTEAHGRSSWRSDGCLGRTRGYTRSQQGGPQNRIRVLRGIRFFLGPPKTEFMLICKDDMGSKTGVGSGGGCGKKVVQATRVPLGEAKAIPTKWLVAYWGKTPTNEKHVRQQGQLPGFFTSSPYLLKGGPKRGGLNHDVSPSRVVQPKWLCLLLRNPPGLGTPNPAIFVAGPIVFAQTFVSGLFPFFQAPPIPHPPPPPKFPQLPEFSPKLPPPDPQKNNKQKTATGKGVL